MRKILLSILTLLCALGVYAGDYNYLVFTNTAGTTTAMDVTNLTMTVSGTSLQVSNSTENVSFALTDLAAMQFSTADTLTALGNVLEADKPVQVYTPTGLSLGTFESLRKAVSSLNKGVYVITDGTNSQTIILQ